MTSDLEIRIRNHLAGGGYPDRQINTGIFYAMAVGYDDDDEALSLVVSRILYSNNQLAAGAHFSVEPGSWGEQP